MNPKVYLPYMKLFGYSFISLARIKAAGFDGVEIHIAGYSNKERLLETIAKAHTLGLETRVHQAWSLEESPTFWFNHLLNLFGQLPRTGYTLAEHLPADDVPAVVYANRWGEVVGHDKWLLQTCEVFDKDGNFKTSYKEFVRVVKTHDLGVVFDTQHVLEFMLNLHGVEGLPTDKEKLLELLIKAWDDLGPYVREIHLNDSNPRLGHHKGRNVFLGTGILPLKEFVRHVKQSGWNGIVTPEMSPLKLLKPGELERLRHTVLNLFKD